MSHNIRGLITPLITTHEPPGRLWVFRCRAGGTKGLHFEGSGLVLGEYTGFRGSGFRGLGF